MQPRNAQPPPQFVTNTDARPCFRQSDRPVSDERACAPSVLFVNSMDVLCRLRRRFGLCAGMTDARFTTTTEVYPDSPRATPEQCNDAQVAAVCAAIEFALAREADAPILR